jgi:hypothetical protein
VDGGRVSSGEGGVEIVKAYATFFDSLNRPCGIYYFEVEEVSLWLRPRESR